MLNNIFLSFAQVLTFQLVEFAIGVVFMILGVAFSMWQILRFNRKDNEAKFASKESVITLTSRVYEDKKEHKEFIKRTEFEMLMSTMTTFNDRQSVIENDIKVILQRLPKK